jgi:3-oxoacyl-[acyl-carrier-protein] synthase II
MKKAIFKVIKPEELDLINCHATSTETGDISEVRAIHSLGAKNALISANKGNLGHTFGAAGAIESIFTILSLKEVIIN